MEMTKEGILANLPPEYPWRKQFEFFTSLDSTNDRLKLLARQGAAHGSILIADHQTGGHGRRGRSFLSPPGSGIYLSVLLRPDCLPQQLLHLTCATAVAMCDAINDGAGFRPGIKWTNDLVAKGKKLCGILSELGFTPEGRVDYAIVGIGLNCCQQPGDFPPEIREVAGSLAMIIGQEISRDRVAAAMMTRLAQMWAMLFDDKQALMDRYRRNCITLGKAISVVKGDDIIRHGTALDVDSDGALVVRFDTGETEAVSSGEVSVRGLYGYV